MKRNTFLRGALILVVCNIVGKLLGAFYKIPLANIVGTLGMGQYQLVFPIYCLLLTVSSSGLSTAISKLVAEFKAEGRTKDIKRLLGFSVIILIAVSALLSAAVVFSARPLARAQGNEDAYICYFAIAPSVVFVAVMSALRGYFQGNLLMFPTAFSGLVEQACKVGFGLFLAKKFSKYSVSASVFGALVGISISELFALVFLLICYVFYRKNNKIEQNLRFFSKRELMKKLFSLSLPMTLGSVISPISSMLDSILTVNLLVFSGIGSSAATALFGIQSGIVEPLIALPVVVATSISTSMLPNLSGMNLKGESEKVISTIKKALKITLSISLASAICFVIFAKPLLAFVFGRSLTPEEFSVALKLLIFSSGNVVFLSLSQVLFGSLQALGRPKKAVGSLAVGCIIKLAVEFVAILVFDLGILSVTISSVVCYFVVFAQNYKKLKSFIGENLFSGCFFISVQDALVCLCAFAANALLAKIVGEFFAFIAAGTLAVAVYGVTYYLFFIKREKLFAKQNEVAASDAPINAKNDA